MIIRNPFKQRTVSDVVKQFDQVVTDLENIQDDLIVKNSEIRESINELESEHSFNMAEISRAMKIKANIGKLLGNG